jgi:hypothetical protein
MNMPPGFAFRLLVVLVPGSLSYKYFTAVIPGATTFSIMTLCVMSLFASLSINDTQNKQHIAKDFLVS